MQLAPSRIKQQTSLTDQSLEHSEDLAKLFGEGMKDRWRLAYMLTEFVEPDSRLAAEPGDPSQR